MKLTLIGIFATCILSLFLPGHTSAIIVGGNAPFDEVLAEPSDYPEVVALLDGRAVGSLIGATWIITAAHVGQYIDQAEDAQEITIAGEPNSIASVFMYPNWDEEALGAPDVIDIALLRLAHPVSTVSPVALYSGRNELNAVVTICGWGRTGDGRNEVLTRDRRFRCGENQVDAVTPRLRFRFDEPDSIRALRLEAVSGPGDSGGPAFIEVDGVRYLAGVSSFQKDVTVPGIFGVTENYERVSDHLEWIDSVIRQ
jgi:hypothetical protein